MNARPLAILLAAALLLGGCADVIRDQVFHPSPLVAAPAWEQPPEAVEVITADGLTLKGLFWAPQDGRSDIMVYFHGNAGNLNRDGLYAAPLAADGRGLLMTSYRGYSGNPGRPTEQGLTADADAFLAHARRRLPPGGRLFVFGHSLGGAVALGAAARQPVDGVATLGTFARIGDLAPWGVRGFMPDRFDNAGVISRIAAPVILFHGTADTVVPFSAAETLRAASGGRARVVALDGADHHPDMRRLAPLVSSAFDPAAPGAAGRPAQR